MNHLLLFHLGETPYALEVERIREIVESPALNYIPKAPASLLGAINHHGAIAPVLDLVACLGYPGEERDRRLILLPDEVCRLALAVSSVGRIVSCDPDGFLPPLERRERDSFARAQFEREGRTVNLLDVTRLVASLQSL